MRLFAEEELSRLDTASRGFLAFLENAGVVDSCQREIIIERALAVEAARVTLQRFKLIVLMVLWSQGGEMDTLIVDELLYETPVELMH